MDEWMDGWMNEWRMSPAYPTEAMFMWSKVVMKHAIIR